MVNFQNLVDKSLLEKYHDQLEKTELKPIKSAVGFNPNGHEYVDLELPSGNMWAKTNIGATNPEDYGLYFAWGETTGYADAGLDGIHTLEDLGWINNYRLDTNKISSIIAQHEDAKIVITYNGKRYTYDKNNCIFRYHKTYIPS